MSASTSPPVTIIGAGFAGLVLGQCLRRREIPARIYQSASEKLTHKSYGITLYRETYEPLLVALGIERQSFLDAVVIRKPSTSEVVSDGSNLRVKRGALTHLLAEGLDVRWEHRFTGLGEHDTARRTAAFATADGDVTSPYDLLIAADGVHSATRQALELYKSVFVLETIPCVVFNGKRRMDTQSMGPSVQKDLERCFEHPDGITYRRNGVVLSIKADFWDAEKQQMGISYTLSRPAADSDVLLLNRNTQDAKTLSRCFKDEATELGQLPPPFNTVFDTAAMEQDRLLHWLMRSSLLNSSAAERFYQDQGVIILGDAAHAQPILGGSGAHVAIADGLALAECIQSAQEVDAAAFYRKRAIYWSQSKQAAEKALHDMHIDIAAKPSL